MAYQYVGESPQSGSKNSTQKYRYSSEQYDSLLEEYKNNPYVLEKLQNNPYLEFEDQPTIFGYLGDNTGLWESAFSKRMKERENLFNQYNADVIADWQNQQRNSPLTQKGLSQDAGMNPDITGVPEGNADSIPTNANEPGLTFEPDQTVQRVFDSIGQAVSIGFGIYNNWLESSMKSMSLFSDVESTADNYAKTLISMGVGGSYDLFLKRIQKNELWNSAVEIGDLSDRLNDLGLRIPKRFQHHFRDAVLRRINSRDFYNHYLNLHNDSVQNEIKLGRSLAHPFYPSENSPWNVEALFNSKNNIFGNANFISSTAESFKPLIKAETDYMLGDFQRKTSENKFHKDYYDNSDGKKYAKRADDRDFYETGSSRFVYNSQKVMDDISSAWRKVVSNIAAKANRGDVASQALLIGLLAGNKALDTFGGFSKFTNPSTGARAVSASLR